MDGEIEKARQKGLLILGYGAYSAKATKQKLRQKGFSEAAADDAVEYLIEKKFLDEKRDALRLCESLIRKKYGRKRILSSLCAKGYGDEAISAAEELCREVIKIKFKELPKDRSEMQKAIAKLSALGYNIGEIKAAMRQ